jgi:hypothetical protein
MSKPIKPIKPTRINGIIKLELNQIFKENTPAVIMTSISGGGKSTMLVDAIHTIATRATSLTVITDSYNGAENQYLRNNLPIEYVRESDLETIIQIWRSACKASNEYTKWTSCDKVNWFIDQYAKNIPSHIDMIRAINETLRTIDADITHLGYSNDNKRDAYDAILLKYNIQFIANNFSSSMLDLSEEGRMVVKYCRATRPFPVIMFDDVTAFMGAISGTSGKITIVKEREGQEDEETMTRPAAAKWLLTDMMTRIRQIGLGFLCVHQLGVFEPKARSSFGPIIFGTEKAIGELKSGVKTFEPGLYGELMDVWNKIKHLPHHKIVYYSNSDAHPYKEKFAVVVAKLHNDPVQIGCPNLLFKLDQIKKAIEESKNMTVNDLT